MKQNISISDKVKFKISNASVSRDLLCVCVCVCVCLQHVHVMKVVTPDDAVCYVTPLNRSLATPPHVYAAQNTDVRLHRPALQPYCERLSELMHDK